MNILDACSPEANPVYAQKSPEPEEPAADQTGFAKGADISWVGASEAAFTFSLEDYMWTGTCVVANAGDSIRVVLGEDIYGGAAGKLIAGGPGIKAEEAGTYTIVLDLRDASNLTYTLTKDR